MGIPDSNLCIKVEQGGMIIIEVYVDDIIFGSDDDILSQTFSKYMNNEFERSLLGEITLFLGLQIYYLDEGIFYFSNQLHQGIFKEVKNIRL
jgi:hypothetical protein